MSETIVLNLHLTKQQLNKLSKGHNIQLSHAQLSTALKHQSNVELHLLKKHAQKVHRAHKNKRGVRLTSKMIIGGKLNLSKLGHQALEMAKQVMKHPTTKKVAKELAHIAVDALKSKGKLNSEYANIAHEGISGNDVTDQLINQGLSDVKKKAVGGKMSKSTKGFVSFLGDTGKSVAKVAIPILTKMAIEGAKNAMQNPQTAEMAMGAGVKKRGRKKKVTAGALFPPSNNENFEGGKLKRKIHGKNMKEHMEWVRSHRNK